jgi:fructosamine-3-kinase
MQEGSAREDLEKGSKADILLKNVVFIEVFENLEKQFLDAWKNSPLKDNEERERIYYLYQSLQALKSGIENVSANGRIAKAQLDRLIGKSK